MLATEWANGPGVDAAGHGKTPELRGQSGGEKKYFSKVL